MSVHPKAAHLRQPGAIGDKGSRPGISGEFPIQPRPVCIYVLIVVRDDVDCVVIVIVKMASLTSSKTSKSTGNKATAGEQVDATG